MTPDITEWLQLRVPEFNELTAEDRNAISDFTFLWALFEGTDLNCNCNMQAIRGHVSRLNENDKLGSMDLEPYVEYFVGRYYPDGEYSHHFPYLRFGSNVPEEVIELFNDEAAAISTKAIGCLAIIYRLRNNLFHGEKWKYSLSDQRSNFTLANSFLREMMDCV